MKNEKIERYETTLPNGSKIVVSKRKKRKLKKGRIAAFAAALTLGISGISYALSNKGDKDVKTTERFEIGTSSEDDTVDTITGDTKSVKEDSLFMKLNELQKVFGINYDTLQDYICYYSEYSNYSFDEALEIVYDNKDSIKQNYNNDIFGGIMDTLFTKAEEEGRVDCHCKPEEVVVKYQTFPNSFYDQAEMDKKMEQCANIEETLVSMCNHMGMTEEEKNLALAIFRQETDYGASERCVYNNNYGGIVFDGEFAVFSNPEFGMYKTLGVMKNFFENAKNNGCTTVDQMIFNIAPTYCTHTPFEWSKSVSSMYYNVVDEYSNTNKTLVR